MGYIGPVNGEINPLAVWAHFEFEIVERFRWIGLEKNFDHVAIPQFVAAAVGRGIWENADLPKAALKPEAKALSRPQKLNPGLAAGIGVFPLPVCAKALGRSLLPGGTGGKSFLVRRGRQVHGRGAGFVLQVKLRVKAHLRGYTGWGRASAHGKTDCTRGLHAFRSAVRLCASLFVTLFWTRCSAAGAGGKQMPDLVDAPDFLTRPERRRPEQFQFVKLRVDSGVARMTLDRPEHNLLNETMLREIADGIDWLGGKDEVKLVVLGSACKVFCGGIDIGEYTSQRVFQMVDAFHAAFAAMLEVAKPVLCVVNGPAIGGGAELAAFGDLVIATPKARFAQPEITIGMFPPLASTILPFLVGPKIALELVLTGEPISAERALELGIVNRLVPEAKLEATVNELSARISGHSGPVLTMAKKAILGGMGMSLRDGLKHSMNIFLNELYRLEDSQEGLRALVEKRKPQWKNR